MSDPTRVIVIGQDRNWIVDYVYRLVGSRDLEHTPEGYLFTQPLPSLRDTDEIHIITRYNGPMGLRSMRTYSRWLDIAESADIPITEVPV